MLSFRHEFQWHNRFVLWLKNEWCNWGPLPEVEAGLLLLAWGRGGQFKRKSTFPLPLQSDRSSCIWFYWCMGTELLGVRTKLSQSSITEAKYRKGKLRVQSTGFGSPTREGSVLKSQSSSSFPMWCWPEIWQSVHTCSGKVATRSPVYRVTNKETETFWSLYWQELAKLKANCKYSATIEDCSQARLQLAPERLFVPIFPAPHNKKPTDKSCRAASYMLKHSNCSAY